MYSLRVWAFKQIDPIFIWMRLNCQKNYSVKHFKIENLRVSQTNNCNKNNFIEKTNALRWKCHTVYHICALCEGYKSFNACDTPYAYIICITRIFVAYVCIHTVSVLHIYLRANSKTKYAHNTVKNTIFEVTKR